MVNIIITSWWYHSNEDFLFSFCPVFVPFVFYRKYFFLFFPNETVISVKEAVHKWYWRGNNFMFWTILLSPLNVLLLYIYAYRIYIASIYLYASIFICLYLWAYIWISVFKGLYIYAQNKKLLSVSETLKWVSYGSYLFIQGIV